MSPAERASLAPDVRKLRRLALGASELYYGWLRLRPELQPTGYAPQAVLPSLPRRDVKAPSGKSCALWMPCTISAALP